MACALRMCRYYPGCLRAHLLEYFENSLATGRRNNRLRPRDSDDLPVALAIRAHCWASDRCALGSPIGAPAPARRFLPELIDLVWTGKIRPGKVFDLEPPFEQVAEAYRAMDERRAIKALLWVPSTKENAMPHVVVKMKEGRSEEQKRRTAELVTKAIMDGVGCDESKVSVAIVDIPSDDWVSTVYRTEIEPKLDTLYKKPGTKPD